MPRGGRRGTNAELRLKELKAIRQVVYTSGKKRAVHLAYLYAHQNGNCAICRDPLDETAVIDHCHTTGRIRGLLCRPCNLMLGAARDDPDTLRRGANYVVASQWAHEVPSDERISGPLDSPPGGRADPAPPQA